MSERTLVLIKPDGVARGLVGEVIGRIERKGFRIVAMELRTLTVAVAEEHYAEHKGKGFFNDLVEFITGGPLVAAVIEGPDAIVQWRSMMGATPATFTISGCSTPSAMPPATAASTALPPASRIAKAACAAP